MVLATQKAFSFGQDSANINETFFTRLLAPVVAQLSAELPESIAVRELSYGKSRIPEDAMGLAVVGALVQMGVRSGEESFLKPLHHQVSSCC